MDGVMIIADSKGRGFCFAKGVYDYLKLKNGNVKLADIETFNFKDGEFKVKISENIRRKKCFLIHDSNKSPERWFCELIFILEAMSFSSPSEINVILPYTRFARQDRKDESRVSVNAKALADCISLYATRGMTVDLHSGQMQEFFSIPFDNFYSFPSLIYYLKERYPQILDDLIIVAPDLGDAKRAEALVKRLKKSGIEAGIALGHKTKERDNEVSKVVVIGDVKDKNCLIVDDIIDTGGTMVKTAERLKEMGAKSVYAYGTHGLFTDGFEKFNVFDKVFVSDSVCNNFPSERFEVISLVSLFGEAIYRTVLGESVSSLFK